MVRNIETGIRQTIGEVKPEITILARRWWSNLSSNFTLTLAGTPSLATILKYKDAILKPFGPNIFKISLDHGQTRLVFQGVPIYKKADGSLPTTDELCEELGHNLPY
jgi:hypothetical protein